MGDGDPKRLASSMRAQARIEDETVKKKSASCYMTTASQPNISNA
jgi:hypothetical protein